MFGLDFRVAGGPAVEEVHDFHHGILLLLAPLLAQLCAHVIEVFDQLLTRITLGHHLAREVPQTTRGSAAPNTALSPFVFTGLF